MSENHHYDVIIMERSWRRDAGVSPGAVRQKDPLLERGDFVPRRNKTGIRGRG